MKLLFGRKATIVVPALMTLLYTFVCYDNLTDVILLGMLDTLFKILTIGYGCMIVLETLSVASFLASIIAIKVFEKQTLKPFMTPADICSLKSSFQKNGLPVSVTRFETEGQPVVTSMLELTIWHIIAFVITAPCYLLLSFHIETYILPTYIVHNVTNVLQYTVMGQCSSVMASHIEKLRKLGVIDGKETIKAN